MWDLQQTVFALVDYLSFGALLYFSYQSVNLLPLFLSTHSRILMRKVD